ncbi:MULTISPECIES: tripartite tricarboxylate transporter substrate binding protein [Halomonas]|uniref:tripartite tricarboxylate transporter substrate binding protein n=1 Tax=Halomonas TaxID=2745 RepID=UPI001A8F86EE|nr:MULTISPECIES: tripartite tricarboxylate transporter substrate binding protein [Halomonas]MED5294904.1 tripartite tricarboxylate transporter substrate binding protein [Pseudomonadota bacterium]MBN8412092.1 tripartite tricarboxylate transporter substrate binding protein [Halomonas litopenaei]MBY5968323.1 tripartite tricarboxylate transporter substrate binding protein [Halomonas denitrificans]MBY6028118.1 tripartite tricarboxylate transporter substrate binding protein [Halomonas sp. DP8Y7-1]MB
MRLSTTFTLTAMLAASSLVAPLAMAEAEDFPSKDIQYVIPFGPGGESDISARLQQKYFQELTGEQLVIQYMPGGGGAVGWSQLNDMSADGYTIMGTNLPHIVLKPMGKDAGFATQDIHNFTFFHYSPDAILVNADSPYQTLEELVEAARQAPGAVTFSGSGTYSANDVANTRFQQLADVTTTYIPFKGTGAAVTALLGGQVQAEWGYTTVAANHQDKVRMLAVAADERHPLFPDVPTFQELGYDMVGGAYRGMAVPAGTPDAVTAKLSQIFGEINQNPQFRQEMEDLGFVLLDVGNDEVADFLVEQSAQYETSARELGLID